MPSQQTIRLQAKGLWNQYSRLQMPLGALLVAAEVTIDREGVISKRRGFDRYNSVAFDNAPGPISEFRDKIVVFDGSTLKTDDGTGTFTALAGTYTKPSDAVRIRFAEGRNSLYFTTNGGVQKLDSLTGTPVRVGVQKGLDIQLTANGATGWMADDSAVAYKVVWIKEDANGEQPIGTPSQRATITNSSGNPIDVDLVSTIPDEIVAGDFYEIYRSLATAAASTDPGDDVKLVNQRIEVTAADITAGTISFSDIYDEVFLGEDLYTNTTKEGLEAGNERPPLALSVAWWKNVMWYGNTQREQRKRLQLIDVASLSTGDTITITGAQINTYTADTNSGNEDPTTQTFHLEKTLGAASLNINATVDSLIKVINRDPNNTEIIAYRITGQLDGATGAFWVESRSTGGVQLRFNATTGTSWAPELSTAGSEVLSDNEDEPHRLYFSKQFKPEAVPLLDFFEIGRVDNPILALVPLKDSLIVVKEEGIWRVSGDSTTSFNERAINTTIFTSASETAVQLGDRVYVMTNEGVVRVNEYGAEIVSHSIEVDLRPVSLFNNFDTLAHAVAYEGINNNKYLLWTPASSGSTQADKVWVYNYLLDVWTTWSKPCSSGHMLQSDRTLYATHNTDAYILQQRNSFDSNNNDFSDEEIDVTVTATGTTTDSDGNTVSTVTVTYTYSGEELVAGFRFRHAATASSSEVKSVVDNGSNSFTLTLDDDLSSVLPTPSFSASVLISIDSVVQWAPIFGQSVGLTKFFEHAQIYMEGNNALTNLVSTTTNRDGTKQTIKYPVTTSGFGWGDDSSNADEDGWGDGDSEWGDPISQQSHPISWDIPLYHRMAEELNIEYEHKIAKESFDILQLSVSFSTGSETTSRAV